MSVRWGHEVSEVGGGHGFSGWVNEVEAEGLLRWMRRGFPRKGFCVCNVTQAHNGLDWSPTGLNPDRMFPELSQEQKEYVLLLTIYSIIYNYTEEITYNLFINSLSMQAIQLFLFVGHLFLFVGHLIHTEIVVGLVPGDV
jgi:hypothetical protein